MGTELVETSVHDLREPIEARTIPLLDEAEEHLRIGVREVRSWGIENVIAVDDEYGAIESGTECRLIAVNGGIQQRIGEHHANEVYAVGKPVDCRLEHWYAVIVDPVDVRTENIQAELSQDSLEAFSIPAPSLHEAPCF